MRPARWLVVWFVALGAVRPVGARIPLAAGTYRVFLKDGQALPSYGDAARVGDRLVFNLPIAGASDRFLLQLMSLPVAVVDVDRTSRYSEAMRARFYAATRGESDYNSLTAGVMRDLEQLNGLNDRKRQLFLAEELRQRLRTWPGEHFHYRAKDVDELVNLFSDVINELRVAAGESAFSLDLSAGPPEPLAEPILGAPEPGESVELALVAALVADIGEERVAILRTAATMVGGEDMRLRQRVARRLEEEVRAGVSYAALVTEFRTRADLAAASGNVRAVERLPPELMKRDQQLGFRRPQQVQRLVEELQVKLEATRAYRSALDRHAALRRSLLGYERDVRPALSGLDGLSPVLVPIRDMKGMAFAEIVSAESRLRGLQEAAERVTPPEDAAAIHATLVSALRMAREACVRRQQASVTAKSQALREASSAAAGALLLADRARADLVAALVPPRVQ